MKYYFIASILFAVVSCELVENKLSRCVFNNTSGHVICVHTHLNTSVSYTDVLHVWAENFVYCLTTITSPNVISCTGYTYARINTYISPIARDPIAPVSGRVFPHRELFDGYDIMISSFSENAVSVMSSAVTGINTKGPLVTCIDMESGTSECFGDAEVTLMSAVNSFVRGVIISGPISLFLYSFTFKCNAPTKSFDLMLYYVVMVPVMNVASSYFFNQAMGGIVKTAWFTGGTVIGFSLGMTLACMCKCNACKRRTPAVDVDRGASVDDQFDEDIYQDIELRTYDEEKVTEAHVA